MEKFHLNIKKHLKNSVTLYSWRHSLCYSFLFTETNHFIQRQNSWELRKKKFNREINPNPTEKQIRANANAEPYGPVLLSMFVDVLVNVYDAKKQAL